MTPREQRRFDRFVVDLHKNHPEWNEEKLQEQAFFWWSRWKAQTDLYWLAGEIFGMRAARDAKTRRRRLDPRLHRQMCHEIMREGDKLLLYPRDHMKSTFTKFRIIQLLLISPAHRIALWTKTLALGKKELKSIKGLLQNRALQDLFPDIVTPAKSWEKNTATELTMLREPDPKTGYLPQESQIEVWGIESTVTGHHYDYHFYDDIIDKDSIRTAEQIQKVMEWWQDIQGLKQIGTEECMTGTRKHERDIYNTIIRERYFPTVVVHKAIQAGRPIYSYFTLSALQQRKRQMGDYKFSLEFMNDPLPDSERLFRGPFDTFEKLPDWTMKHYITVDVAYSVDREANWTGIAVGAVPVKSRDHVFFREAMRLKEKPDVIADVVLKLLVKYHPKRLGIEAMAYSAIRYIIDLKVKEYEDKTGTMLTFEYFPIPQKVGKQTKADKIDGTLGAFVRDGRCSFDANIDPVVFTQMECFNRFSDKNDDDVIDACAMLIMTVEDFSHAHLIRQMGYTPVGQFTIENLRGLQRKAEYSWEHYFAS